MKIIVTNKISKRRLLILLGVVIYKLLVDLGYVELMTPIFGYMALETNINIAKSFVGFFVVVILAAFIRWEENRFSDQALQILFIVSIVPLSTYYAMNDKSSTFFLCCSFSFLLTTILTSYSIFPKQIKIKGMFNMPRLFAVIYVCIILFFGYIIIRQGVDFSYLNIFDSKNIYSARQNYNLHLGTGATYLFSWGTRIIIPLFAGYLFSKRKIFLGGVLVAVQFLVYFGNPHKELILGIVMMFAVVLFSRKMSPGKTFIFFGGFSIILALLLNGIAKSITLKIAALLSRLLYIPASLKFLHYEFFSSNQKLWFSEGRIGRLLGINYPYDTSVGIVIGRHFFSVDSNCNTGYLAYAYDDLGYWGIVLVSIGLFFILKIVDSFLGEKANIWVIAALLYPVIMLNDSAFLSWLLTVGVIFLIVLLKLCKEQFNRNCEMRLKRIKN